MDDLQKNIAEALESIRRNDINLRNLPIEFRENREVVLEAISIKLFAGKFYGQDMEYISPKLRADPEFIIELAKQRIWTFEYASDEIKNNAEIVSYIVETMSNGGYALMHASKEVLEELQNDRNLILKAVQTCGFIFQHVSQELQNDREIVLAAVKDIGRMLEYAPQKFKSDREIVLEAARAGYALKYASQELRDDKEVVLAALGNLEYPRDSALEFASPRLRNDREVVLEGVKQCGYSIIYSSPRFGDDKEVVLAALLPESLGGDPEERFASISLVESCISRRLREDPEVFKAFSWREDIQNYDEITSKFFHSVKLREFNEKQETDWQNRHGQKAKARLERWRDDQVQWQQDQKKYRYESYKSLRAEIELVPQYEHWRQSVFQKFGRKCAVCGSTENLEVDHRYKSFHTIVQENGIKNITQAYECAALWDVNNGAPLCKTHHDETASSLYHKQKQGA